MIITRTPFRVSFCGGGSDIPSFYEKNGGCVISTTIDKYMYITTHPSFQRNQTVLKYSKTEIVENIEEIDHRIFKQCLQDFNTKGVEITSIADVPQGTGLGSSSSFTVGLLHNLYSFNGKFASKEMLAQKACNVEIDELKEPIGKQDQYAAAYGGLNYYRFNRDGSVFIEPIIMEPESYKKLEKNLVMFSTGGHRSASNILKEQSKNIASGDKEKNQIEICKLTEELKIELEKNNVDAIGEILHKSWMLKKTLAAGISNPDIDRWYDTALENGATGGKLLGAGGGGFLLFYVPTGEKDKLIEKLPELKEMDFKFDWQGSTVVYVGGEN